MITQERMLLFSKIDTWLDSHPFDGLGKIEDLLSDQKILWTPQDVAHWTGWSVSHVRDLCESGVLPHIQGKHLRFLRKPLLEALESLLVGGRYRPRKGKSRKMTAQRRPHGGSTV